jgi:hypothetical protein
LCLKKIFLLSTALSLAAAAAQHDEVYGYWFLAIPTLFFNFSLSPPIRIESISIYARTYSLLAPFAIPFFRCCFFSHRYFFSLAGTSS